MRSLDKISRQLTALAVAAALLALAPGCGGSSSETPPPLEPNPHAAPPAATAEPASRPSLSRESDIDAPPRPARSTWGPSRGRTLDAGAR